MDEAQIIKALDLAQCELRAMYKKLGYQDSNVLREIDAVHEALTKQKKLNKHDVSGWRPPYGKLETAAKKHASEILGIPPNEVRDDDTIVNGFLAGVEWWVFGAACR